MNPEDDKKRIDAIRKKIADYVPDLINDDDFLLAQLDEAHAALRGLLKLGK